MNTFNKILIATLLGSTSFSCLSAATIEFHIEGVKQADGPLMIQLFKGEEAFDAGSPLVATAVSATSDKTVVTFNNIEVGDYALRFFHDENGNGKMETNFFGLPSEGYGFSNNAKPNFGPVPYSEMAFVVTEQDDVVVNTTRVIY